MQSINPPSRQPYETITQFLTRLPPAQAESTFLPHLLPSWYWISNPNRCDDGNKNVDEFTYEGAALLQRFTEAAALTKRGDGGKARLREELKGAIGEVAKKWGVTSGKWMLFPKADQVNEVWRLVCEGVDANRLGTGAKVSTSGQNFADPARLICVYTKDFTDVEDVRRVLLGLMERGLVTVDMPRGITYKCDAYTYLGIYSKNEYGLPASIYGSKDMLASMGENSDDVKMEGC